MTLVLENVSKQFGKHQVIDNLSVVFQPGMKYILRGRSGAGKSTILNIIARFDDDCQGDITYDSGNLKTIKKSLKGELLIICQLCFSLVWKMTILNIIDNLLLCYQNNV